MTKRKPPIRHKVKSHIREGKSVRGFERGRGTRQQRRVAVKEKYPKKVAEDVYIYKALDEDQKNRFNIWLKIHTLQQRMLKTYRISWREAEKVLEDANNYYIAHKKKWWPKHIGREEAYMRCLRILGRRDGDVFIACMDNFKAALHSKDGVEKFWERKT